MTEPKIRIILPKGEYDYLNDVLEGHKDTLHKLGINEGFKNSLIKDVHIIRSIIHKTEKGE
jgi:hypothetical protein